MTNKEFLTIMKPLVDFFGEKQYAGRMHIIFDDLKDLPVWAIDRIVKTFLTERSVYEAPLPKDFAEEGHRLRSLINNGNPRYRPDCFDLQPPGEALQKILEERGVVSIIELIKKRKQNQSEGA